MPENDALGCMLGLGVVVVIYIIAAHIGGVAVGHWFAAHLDAALKGAS